MEKPSKTSSGTKQAFNPTKKFDSREHPLLSEDSPLNRQILKATGFPDMKALLHALAHPMEEGDLYHLGVKAGDHLAHHHRIRHLRKMALQQHGPIEAYDPNKQEEPMGKAVWGRRLSMGDWVQQYRKLKEQTDKDTKQVTRAADKTVHYFSPNDPKNLRKPSDPIKQESWAGGMDFGDNQRITRHMRGNYSGWLSDHNQNWEKYFRAPGQSIGDSIKNIGSRGGHWYVDRLGHKQYGEAPPPFRAKVHQDSNPDDQHIRNHFNNLGIPDEWHGNQILYAEPKELHQHALALAASTDRSPEEWEGILKQKQTLAREQFRQAHTAQGMTVRKTVPLRERDIKEYKPHLAPGEKPSEDPEQRAKYAHYKGEDERMARLRQEFYHTVPSGRNIPELDDLGQPKRVADIDPKTGKQKIYTKGAKAGELKWLPVTKPEMREELRTNTGVRVNQGKLQRGKVRRDEKGKVLLDDTGKPGFDYEDVMEDRDMPVPEEPTYNVPMPDASGNIPVPEDEKNIPKPRPYGDIDPIYVGRLLKIWHDAPVKFREDQREWYSGMARQFIKDLADASGISEVKTAGVLALFNNGMGWNVGSAGAAQLLLGDTLGLKFMGEKKYSAEEQAAGSPEYQYHAGDPRSILGDTYPDVLAKMRRIVNAGDDREAMKITKSVLGTNKLGDFWMDMMGSEPYVTGTLDRHMVGVFGYKVYGKNPLTGQREWYQPDAFNDTEYRYFHRALLSAAQQLGVEPRELQAVTWVVYQQANAADSTTGAAFNPKALEHIHGVVTNLANRHRIQKKRNKGFKVQHSPKRATPESTFQDYFNQRNLGREAGADPITGKQTPEITQDSLGESKKKY